MFADPLEIASLRCRHRHRRSAPVALVLLLVTGSAATALGETSTEAPSEAPSETPVFEVTFGTTVLFQPSAGDVSNIPVSSALLIYEHFLTPSLHLVGGLNLPMSSQSTVLPDGRTKESYAPASALLGLNFTAYEWRFRKSAQLELQVGALAGRVLAAEGRYYPLLVGRVHVLKDQGFGLYVGTAYAFRVETMALVYGAGHRF